MVDISPELSREQRQRIVGLNKAIVERSLEGVMFGRILLSGIKPETAPSEMATKFFKRHQLISDEEVDSVQAAIEDEYGSRFEAMDDAKRMECIGYLGGTAMRSLNDMLEASGSSTAETRRKVAELRQFVGFIMNENTVELTIYEDLQPTG